MKKHLKQVLNLLRDESGQGMVEYVLIIATVVLGSYFLMWVLADLLVRYYDEIAAHVCLPVP